MNLNIPQKYYFGIGKITNDVKPPIWQKCEPRVYVREYIILLGGNFPNKKYKLSVKNVRKY